MINNTVNKEEENRKEVLKSLRKKKGLSISDLVRQTNLTRTQIRTALAYLLGSKKINQTHFGMAKVYYII